MHAGMAAKANNLANLFPKMVKWIQDERSAMPRQEFPRAIKAAVIKRATHNLQIICEECGSSCTQFEIDHRNPCGLTGEATLENAFLLCRDCHAEKTKNDVAVIAKAKRVEANYLGVKTVPVRKIQSRGFAKSEKAAKRQPREAVQGQCAFARQIQNGVDE